MSLLASPAAPAPGAGDAPPAAPPSAPPSGAPPGAPPSQGSPPAGDAGTSTPYYRGLYGEDGTIDKKAWDRLPEHLKGHKEAFSQHGSMDALLTYTANLASLAGKKGLAPLPANAPDHVKAERSKLLREINGAPDKPEGYAVKRPEQVPEGMWSDEYANGVVGILHRHNASPDLVNELIGFDGNHAAKMLELAKTGKEQQETAHMAEQVKALETALPNQAERSKALTTARRAALTVGLDPDKNPIFKSADAVLAFAKLGSYLSEDKLVSGDGGDPLTGGGNDFAKAQDILSNPDNAQHKAYRDASHPQHKQTVDLVNKLFERHAAKVG